MTTLANKLQLNFEPGMPVTGDAAADTDTLAAMRQTLGGLALIRYKPASLVYVARGTFSGTATVKLMAGADVLASRTMTFAAGVASDSFRVDLSDVAGETELFTRVTVDSAGAGGDSFDVEARLEIEPVTVVLDR